MGQRCMRTENGERRPEHGRMPLQGVTPEGLNIYSSGQRPVKEVDEGKPSANEWPQRSPDYFGRKGDHEDIRDET
jgi:hypothetical protein